MPYSPADLKQISEALVIWNERLDNLETAILTRKYKHDRAIDFAKHGLSRRLQTLRHCLDRTFEVVPPQSDNPSRSELQDATAFIQTFVVNTYGAIDNLAHIWCLEFPVKDCHGNELNPKFIGLTPKNTTIRKTLPSPFKENMEARDEWFRYLTNYRDALAHRIPLYIIPRILNEAAQAEYRKIEARKSTAISERDWPAFHELNARQDRIGIFEPYIVHSLDGGAVPMRFHPQMVCDMATVVEIGEQLLCELDKLQ
jgi:hypothetical protein